VYIEDETSNARTFGDILVVQNANLPERKFPLTREEANEYNSHCDDITEELKKILQHLSQNNVSPSYFFIDVHISADTIQYLQYASTRKYNMQDTQTPGKDFKHARPRATQET
jgi:hypothetical protein